MTKILGFTIPCAGHVFPMIGTLLESRARGHEVLMAGGPAAPGFAPAPTAARPRAVPVEAWVAGLSAGELRVAAPKRPDRRRATTWDAWLLCGAPAAEDLASLVAQEHPDRVVLDPALWGAMVAAEAIGLPCATIAHSSRYLPAMGRRLFGPGMAPATGGFSRWLQRTQAWAADRYVDAYGLPRLNALRTEHGLGRIRHEREQLYSPAITVACTAEPFEYPRQDWHASVRFVGPILWEPSGKEPCWIKDLDDRPIVLVCTSTVEQADDQLVQVALKGLAAEDLQVVATVPTGRCPELVPANARVTGFVPHSCLLPRALCVVCHAGLGITQRALAAGVPVVAVPYGRDQLEVARRVEVAQAGVLIRPTELTPERLRDAVRGAARHEPGAARVAAAFRRAGGAAAAGAVIEEVLYRRGSASSAGWQATAANMAAAATTP